MQLPSAPEKTSLLVRLFQGTEPEPTTRISKLAILELSLVSGQTQSTQRWLGSTGLVLPAKSTTWSSVRKTDLETPANFTTESVLIVMQMFTMVVGEMTSTMQAPFRLANGLTSLGPMTAAIRLSSSMESRLPVELGAPWQDMLSQ